MHHPVALWQILDNRSKIHHARDLALVDFADLGLASELCDPGEGFLRAFRIRGGDHYQPVIIDVNRLDACFRDNLVDGLAARTDDVADKLGIDAQADDARRIGREFGARRGNGLCHFVEDLPSCDLCLGERLFHHVR